MATLSFTDSMTSDKNTDSTTSDTDSDTDSDSSYEWPSAYSPKRKQSPTTQPENNDNGPRIFVAIPDFCDCGHDLHHEQASNQPATIIDAKAKLFEVSKWKRKRHRSRVE